tara:strand:+ start:335 stop:1000 length:666 start_codon:yes stop_codon:yes gene_type:complete
MKATLKSKIVYVITEIIIISIGVLFAFFITNTNNKLKESEREKKIVYDLIQDIKYNIEQAEYSLTINNKIILDCEYSVKSLKNGDFDLDSLPIKLPALTFVIINQIKTSTYESIKNSGELSIIQNEILRKIIAEYYISSDDVRRVENIFNNFSDDSRQFIQKNIDIKNIRNHPKELLSSSEFYNLFHSAKYYTEIRGLYYQEFASESTKLEEQLKKYYETL